MADSHISTAEFQQSICKIAKPHRELSANQKPSREPTPVSSSISNMSNSNVKPNVTPNVKPNVTNASAKRKGSETGSSKSFRPMQRTMMMMPDDMLSMILALFSFDEISELRLVCHRFNRVCQRLLNQGLQLLERYHLNCNKKLKSQLPRRESERRLHPLSKHCDILSAVETRLSLLAMTYCKYIDLKVCCFIPGKVIDESFTVLKVVMDSKEAPRTHDLLQELRDISSMAMEHFDEKIAPDLKKQLGENRPTHAQSIGAALSMREMPNNSNIMPSTSGHYIKKLQGQIKTSNFNLVELMNEFKVFKTQMLELRKVKEAQVKKVTQQQQLLVELSSKVTSQDERIAEQECKMALLEQQVQNIPRTSQQFFDMEESNGKVVIGDHEGEEGIGGKGDFETATDSLGEEDNEVNTSSVTKKVQERRTRKRKVTDNENSPSKEDENVSPDTSDKKKRRQRVEKKK